MDLLKARIILCCKVQNIFLLEIENILLDTTFNVKVK